MPCAMSSQMPVRARERSSKQLEDRGQACVTFQFYQPTHHKPEYRHGQYVRNALEIPQNPAIGTRIY